MYVTIEEHVKLQELGAEHTMGRLSDQEFIQAVYELTGVNTDTLVRHVWTVEVVDEETLRVRGRCGRSWATRGAVQDYADRRDKFKILEAIQRMLNSLKPEQGNEGN